MSLRTFHHQGLCKSSSCTTFTRNSHWVRTATGKTTLGSVLTGPLRYCLTLRNPVGCGLPGLSVREGVLQARILERIGQDWLPYPSRALYILLPELPTPLSTWSFKNPCNPSSCTTSIPGPHRGKPKSFRAGSAANPSGRLTYRGGNKTTVETQGQCG